MTTDDFINNLEEFGKKTTITVDDCAKRLEELSKNLNNECIKLEEEEN